MNNYFFTYRHIFNCLTYSPNNTSCVRSTSVKILFFTFFLTIGNNINRETKACPNIVIINSCGHNINQHIFRTNLWCINHLTLPSFSWFSKPILSNSKSVHFFRNLTQRWHFSQIIKWFNIHIFFS